jgi:hypothetical protein
MMSKKILTVLAPVAAIVAFMALPALAQAAVQVQCGSSECAANTNVRGQATTNLKTQVQTGAKDEGELVCTGSTFEGKVENAQSETSTGIVTEDNLTGCTAKGVSADVKTNANAAGGGWQIHVQGAPSNEIHIEPHTGQSITFTVQVQVFGFSAATCTYSSSGINLTSTAQSDTSSVKGNEQFVLTGSNSSECGTVGTTKGDLTGSFQLETNPGNAAVVYH